MSPITLSRPRIQTLTMRFHFDKILHKEHEAIIDFIVNTWRFPPNPKHAGYHYSSADKVQKISLTPFTVKRLCNTDAEDGPRWAMETGPRMHTWTITWARKRHDGPQVYLYGGLVQVDGQDWQEDGDEEEEVD
ncbi:hypothetical protein PspLS_09300 [Pyricularia sp. CBS 133598]|nr:hypothetical protein PspLS_09300 [Pyricularia sp. CBS 133598]